MGQIINGIDKRIYYLGGGKLPELSKNNFVQLNKYETAPYFFY